MRSKVGLNELLGRCSPVDEVATDDHSSPEKQAYDSAAALAWLRPGLYQPDQNVACPFDQQLKDDLNEDASNDAQYATKCLACNITEWHKCSSAA
ncbi:MAG: hypothetical protein QM788_17115 [Roseateles sp.]|uniref:hypothetical protein n=1 Tax=Roseateles sp. TaxID=1971397 RepID=UPI0039E80311